MKVGANKGCPVLGKGFCPVTVTHKVLPMGPGLCPFPVIFGTARAPAESWYNHDTAGFNLDCNQHTSAKALNHSAPQSEKAQK